MPSAPSRQAWAKTMGPSSATCSLRRMPAAVLAGLESQPGAVAAGILRPHGRGQFSERLCCAHAGLLSFLDRPPPRSRYPDPYNLHRLAASHHHLALCCCKPAPASPLGRDLCRERLGHDLSVLHDEGVSAELETVIRRLGPPHDVGRV